MPIAGVLFGFAEIERLKNFRAGAAALDKILAQLVVLAKGYNAPAQRSSIFLNTGWSIWKIKTIQVIFRCVINGASGRAISVEYGSFDVRSSKGIGTDCPES